MSVSRRPSPRTSSPYFRTCASSSHDAVGEVLGGGSDDRQRRPELVGHRRDEFHLLLREPLRTACRQEQQRHAGAENTEDAGAHEQVAPPGDGHRRLERA